MTSVTISTTEMLTEKRPVGPGIDAALEPDKFEKMDLPPATRKTYTGYVGLHKKKDAKKILWTDAQPDARGCQRQCEIIRGAPGLKSLEAKSVETKREAFNLLFSF